MKVLDFKTIKKMYGNEFNSGDCYVWVETALKEKTSFDMPAKSRINQEDGDYYAIMPCMYKDFAMVKMIGRHDIKEGESRPAMMSDLMLYEAKSGIIKGLMDGELITTLRTGAAAAHSALMFAKSDFDTVAIIGLGNIMTVCMDVFLDKIKGRPIKLKVYKHHDQEKRIFERYKHYENVEFIFCDTYDETMANSDVIFSAVTRVQENFCKDKCYKPGCTVIPIMTMGFQNCDLFFDQVFTDEIEQIRGFKYFDKFKSLTNISDVLNGKAKGRNNDEERIMIYNYGLAIHDLFYAIKLYELADKKGLDIEYNYCQSKFFMD